MSHGLFGRLLYKSMIVRKLEVLGYKISFRTEYVLRFHSVQLLYQGMKLCILQKSVEIHK